MDSLFVWRTAPLAKTDGRMRFQRLTGAPCVLFARLLICVYFSFFASFQAWHISSSSNNNYHHDDNNNNKKKEEVRITDGSDALPAC